MWDLIYNLSCLALNLKFAMWRQQSSINHLVQLVSFFFNTVIYLIAY